MCRSAIYAVNSTEQAVSSVVSFGSIVRRFGQNCNLSGGNVVTKGCGYYDLIVNLTFESAQGEAQISVLKNGQPITGASAAITTAANTNYNVAIPAMFKNDCCAESTITVVSTGAALTVSNAAIEARKV